MIDYQALHATNSMADKIRSILRFGSRRLEFLPITTTIREAIQKWRRTGND